MEVEVAVRKRLLAIPALVGYTTGARVFKDRLDASLDGTGHRAVVVSRVGSWTSHPPGSRNTQEYPLVRLTFWADHDRNSSGQMTKANGRANALALHRVVDPVIHGVRDEWWGGPDDDPTAGLLVIGCTRWSEPIPAGNGALATSRSRSGDAVSYEAEAISVDYAIQTIH